VIGHFAIKIAICLLATFGIQIPAFGSEQADAADKARAEAWILQQMSIRPEERVPPVVRISLSTTRQTTKSLAEIEKAKTELRGFPNHPKQWEVQTWARLAKHAFVAKHTLWVLDDRLWRLCTDRDDGEKVTFSDHGRNDDEGWQLTPGHLATLDDAALARPQLTRPLAVFETHISGFVQYFFGGMGLLPLGSPRLESLAAEQGQWDAMVFSTTGRHRIRFAWIQECNTFFPTKVEMLANADSSVMTTWTYGRPFLGLAQQPTCSEVVFVSHGNGHKEACRLVECESTTAEEIAKYAKTPAPDQSDPVRGVVSIRKISYSKGSDAFVKTMTAQGEVITRTPLPEQFQQQSRMLWYISSATGLAVVGCVLVWKKKVAYA
jgi:hypothetical protein